MIRPRTVSGKTRTKGQGNASCHRRFAVGAWFLLLEMGSCGGNASVVVGGRFVGLGVRVPMEHPRKRFQFLVTAAV